MVAITSAWGYTRNDEGYSSGIFYSEYTSSTQYYLCGRWTGNGNAAYGPALVNLGSGNAGNIIYNFNVTDTGFVVSGGGGTGWQTAVAACYH